MEPMLTEAKPGAAAAGEGDVKLDRSFRQKH